MSGSWADDIDEIEAEAKAREEKNRLAAPAGDFNPPSPGTALADEVGNLALKSTSSGTGDSFLDTQIMPVVCPAAPPTGTAPSTEATPAAPISTPAAGDAAAGDDAAAGGGSGGDSAGSDDVAKGASKPEFGDQFAEALKGAFLFSADEKDVAVTRADPNSPLYSAKRFTDLADLPDTTGIPEPVLKGIRDLGYIKPSRIQEKSLPLLLRNPKQNMIFQSQAGTGKTAAFAITILSRIDFSRAVPQALIVSPTYLLCGQIYEVITKMAKHCGIKVELHYSSRDHQLPRGARITAHIVVGTPGKLANYLKQPPNVRPFDPANVRVFVADEADELIEQNHKDDLIRIKGSLKPARDLQMILLSATFADHIMKFAKEFVPSPVNLITLPQQEVSVDTVNQLYAMCDGDAGKFQALEIIYSTVSLGQTLIFVEQKRTANELARRMHHNGHVVAVITGDLEKEEQSVRLQEFAEGKFKVLITTNIMARGIDVEKISMVVNYDIPVVTQHPQKPPDFDVYLHRVGRTGRFGKRGTALTLVDMRNPRELEMVKAIQDHWKHEIKPLKIDFDEIEKHIASE
eukprot:m.111940 g.111940  ORF g.111940 m.111940 type:complete len:573 (+) comp19258_c0_seq1:148-1866(+)